MPRIYLRPNGSPTGCVAKLPETFAELLPLADAKQLLGGGAAATRIFADTSDEIKEEDFELIEANDVLYVSAGEDWIQPPPPPPPVADAPAATVAATEPVAAAASAAPVAEPMVVDGAAADAPVKQDAEGSSAQAASPVKQESPVKEEEMEEEDDEDDLFEVEGIVDVRTVQLTEEEQAAAAASAEAEGEGEEKEGEEGVEKMKTEVITTRTEYLVVWRGYAEEGAPTARRNKIASAPASTLPPFFILSLSPPHLFSQRTRGSPRRTSSTLSSSPSTRAACRTSPPSMSRACGR